MRKKRKAQRGGTMKIGLAKSPLENTMLQQVLSMDIMDVQFNLFVFESGKESPSRRYGKNFLRLTATYYTESGKRIDKPCGIMSGVLDFTPERLENNLREMITFFFENNLDLARKYLDKNRNV